MPRLPYSQCQSTQNALDPVAYPYLDEKAPDINEIIEAGSITTFFQAQTSPNSGSVFSLEALARGVDPRSGNLIPPDRLFNSPITGKQRLSLDRLCRVKALESFARIGGQIPGVVLSLNFDSSLLDLGVAGSSRIAKAVEAAGLSPDRVIIELVESKVRDVKALEDFARFYKGMGFILALDDVGVGYSNLGRIANLKPDIIKIDKSLIINIDHEYHKRAAANSLIQLAQNTGALVTAEGVEREGEALAALELGVDFLQGFYFGRPAPGLKQYEQASERLPYLTGRFTSHTKERFTAQKERHSYYQKAVNMMLESLKAIPPRGFDDYLSGCSCPEHGLECIYILDGQGRQVTATHCPVRGLLSRPTHVFNPAAKGADQSMKSYYLMLSAGLGRYVTDPYISRASGNMCVTISTWFTSGEKARYILCVDFRRDSLCSGA